MKNPYAPKLTDDRQEVLEKFRTSCEEMGNYITREKSLFMMLHKFPSVITQINKNNVNGTGLYQHLYFKYTQNDLSKDKPSDPLNEGYDSSEDWKQKPDIGFTSILSTQLNNKDLSLDEALYNAFVHGANETKRTTGLSYNLNPQVERTHILNEYLFTNGSLLFGDGKSLLKTIKPSKKKETNKENTSPETMDTETVVEPKNADKFKKNQSFQHNLTKFGWTAAAYFAAEIVYGVFFNNKENITTKSPVLTDSTRVEQKIQPKEPAKKEKTLFQRILD